VLLHFWYAHAECIIASTVLFAQTLVEVALTLCAGARILDITAEVGEGLTHKVPRVRSECLKWLKRCVATTQGATVTNLGPLSELLLKVPLPLPSVVICVMMRACARR
jgi:hypothetical protein